MFTTKPMNPYIEEQQIDELIPFDWDDEETKFEVEDYYDDLTAGIDFSNTNDF
jgi:phage terminase large subunit-like protein